MSRNKRNLFEELLGEVRRSQAATARFDHAVAEALGVNPTDMACIDLLDREGPVTAGRLAASTGLTTGAMTAALDRLERAGYARRVRDPGDRRRVVVELTDRVRDMHSFYAEHLAYSERLYHRYTIDELEFLLRFVRGGRELNETRAAEIEREIQRRGQDA